MAELAGREPAQLRSEIRQRPWSIHDLLNDPNVVNPILDPKAELAKLVSPFLLFAVLVHRVSSELRKATYVNDWTGPKSRLPVFDVAPLQEFLDDPGRIFFLVTLLASFATPEPPPVPANPLNLHELSSWLDQVMPSDRIALLRRLGDLSLFMSGVFPDHTGPKPMRPVDAERLGKTVGMTSDQIIELCDGARISPGLDALESLGSRWYGVAASLQGVPPVVGDVATRFRSARRILNHLTDRYLYRLEPHWHLAA
ncbi:MAG: hypothetical protein ACRDWH_03495 [Acidimicrobiia bacterium]